ncbi:uncharacterized protein LOC143372821 [Andrena cerasifolii]|uniref:uncharacterized protein LOC143372821 n=1 Tax=Andrena cerasifolii TaxID=2819439 RepID=UPI004037A79B
MVYDAPSGIADLVHRDRFNKQHVHPVFQCILMVLLPDRVQFAEQPKANTKMSYPVNDTLPSWIPTFDDTKRCPKCGVILTENHNCWKWKGRNRNAKPHQPRNNTSRSQKIKLDSLVSSKPEASNTRCASTQTEAITCSQTSTTTQTDDVQVDRNENVTRDVLEKMACSRLLLYHLQSFIADLNLE